MVNNYEAKIAKSARLEDNLISPIIHYANLYVAGDDNEWTDENFEMEIARKTIKRIFEKDPFLSDNNRGKYVVAFSFGFVVYTFGDEEEIDSVLVRYKEFEFNDDYSEAFEIKQVRPCQLEDKLKVYEAEIWNKSKIIIDYYLHPREQIAIKNEYPDKSYE